MYVTQEVEYEINLSDYDADYLFSELGQSKMDELSEEYAKDNAGVWLDDAVLPNIERLDDEGLAHLLKAVLNNIDERAENDEDHEATLQTIQEWVEGKSV
jgi:hypothetical protein